MEWKKPLSLTYYSLWLKNEHYCDDSSALHSHWYSNWLGSPNGRLSLLHYQPAGSPLSYPSMADSAIVTPSQNTVPGKDGRGGNTDYTAFVLVPVFFLLGLLGVVICHILKRKGYRCTTEAEDEGEKEGEEVERDLELGG
eukprot:superscaffoldBa00002973_g15785